MGLFAGAMKAVLVPLFTLQGWRVEGERPVHRKCVLVAAPHTSNWDFVCFIGAADRLGLKLSVLAKASLFRWPIAGAMRDLGVVPVDRSKSNNLVAAMADEFARRDDFILTIAPEGTRSRAPRWKTGFYGIAMGAGVPIIAVLCDYQRKVIRVGPTVFPTGRYEEDMAPFIAFYETAVGRFPEAASPILGDDAPV